MRAFFWGRSFNGFQVPTQCLVLHVGLNVFGLQDQGFFIALPRWDQHSRGPYRSSLRQTRVESASAAFLGRGLLRQDRKSETLNPRP